MKMIIPSCVYMNFSIRCSADGQSAEHINFKGRPNLFKAALRCFIAFAVFFLLKQPHISLKKRFISGNLLHIIPTCE